MTLARAHLSRRRVRLRYVESDAARVERTADVLALAFEMSRWLVAAWCPDGGSLRVIDLARVNQVKRLRQCAGPAPQGFDPLDFALHRFLDPAAGVAKRIQLSLDHRTAALAGVLIPSSRTARRRDGVWVCHVRTSRPDVLQELADSLGCGGALHSGAHMPPPRRDVKEKTAEARLLGLAAWILEQSDPVTRQRIYEAFPDDYRGAAEAREKKFSRDKDALRRLGFNLETEQLGKDEGQVGYSIDAHSCTLPTIEFTPEEAALLWTAGTAALRLSQHPLRDELESALRKLMLGARGLPPSAATTGELVADAAPGIEKHLEKLIDAWERRRRVRIRYWRVSSGKEIERDVDVYGWASRRGEWIFAGYCHLRQAVRVFYVSRVRGVKAVKGAKDEGYEIPATFDIRHWSRQQVWDYEIHQPRPAAVRFQGALARIVRQLLPGAKVETDESGARIARLEVRNLRGLVRQALAWGLDAELLEPEDGRKMALEILSSIATGSAP